MFTRNLSNLILNACYTYNSNGSNLYRVTGRDGVLHRPSYNFYSKEYTGNNFRIFSMSTFVFGDSDAEAEDTQYDIQGNEITMTNKSLAIGYSLDSNGKINISYRVRGVPENDGVIKEVAFFKDIYNDNNNVETSAMMYREVLKTPISVTQGTTVSLIFEIKTSLA